eukprot:TRINITY_DN1747_c1_g2_i1.p1 TRINITY_DN1747_c1_g2~~TRINITY_DN1747_c1_g2_i1.p1  ORF type:complete len:346 (-),score=63.30 TRINITY_DN1747_c1_g2_i1:54-1091(-)
MTESREKKIEVVKPSGNVVWSGSVDPDAGKPFQVSDLRRDLRNAGVSDADKAKLLLDDRILSDSDVLIYPTNFASKLARMSVKELELFVTSQGGSVDGILEKTELLSLCNDILSLPDSETPILITFIMEAAPPAKDSEDSGSQGRNFEDKEGNIHTPGGGIFFANGGYSGPGSECFTSDSLVTVLAEDVEKACPISEVKVGDVVVTGSSDLSERYRCITQVWPCRIQHGKTLTVRMSEGCRVTPNHPVFLEGTWQKPPIEQASLSQEEYVYGIELEGHVDTILVGGIKCAAIGVYCGPTFGWNIFTRKTSYCSSQPCEACSIAVDPTINFSSLLEEDLQKEFEPY